MNIFKFRCPFHTQALKEKTLLEFTLNSNPDGRLDIMHKAFTRFYAEPEIPALTFIIPKELLGNYQSLKDLQRKTIKYHCELMATQLDIRLHPMLPYQLPRTKKAFQKILLSKPSNLITVVKSLVASLKKEAPEALESIQGIAGFLEKEMNDGLDRGGPNPAFFVKDVYKLSLSGAVFFPSESGGFGKSNPLMNKNLFYFVTSPDYPKEFGRYSKEVKMVFTRYADIYGLSHEEADDVRSKSNRTLVALGVNLGNDLENAPREGIWIPKYHLSENPKQLAQQTTG